MTAEILRKAASLMRERAEAVPAGPWEKEFSDVIRTDIPFGGNGYLIAETPTVERAQHIASWHPTVALAVADLLEADARLMEQTAFASAHWEEAKSLAVATAYLGDPS